MAIFIIYIIFGLITSVYLNDVPDKYEYPQGTLPCKKFKSTYFDCANRNLLSIPPLPANITWIDLSINDLENITADNFKGQEYLSYITLENNYIEQLTGSPFQDLVALEKLLLPVNWLKNLAPTSFRGLFNLQQLILQHNFLRTLPDDIFTDLWELRVLDLRHNDMLEIPSSSLAPLRSLHTLDLMYNYLYSIEFGQEFQNLTNLRKMHIRSVGLNSSHCGDFEQSHVVLDNNTFQYLDKVPLQFLTFIFDDVDNVTVTVEKGFFTPLRDLSSLKVFNNFNDAVPSIPGNLQNFSTLLIPNDMKLTNDSLDFIEQKSSIKYLDLSFSFINGIYDAVFSEFSNLLVLNLNGVGYSMQHVSDNAFQGLKNLRELYLGNNQMNSIPVKAFQAFSKGSLKILDLSYNALTGEFPDNHSFDSVSSLTHLDLSYNPIATVGSWIHSLTNLKELKLNRLNSNLRIDLLMWTIPLQSLRNFEFCWPDLITTLDYDHFSLSKKAPKLQKVSLQGNYVYDLNLIEGLIGLETLDAYRSFKHFNNFTGSWGQSIYFPNLKVLKLGNNGITRIDCMFLNTTSPAVTYLDFKYNKIKSLLGSSLEMLKYLEYLDLTDNNLETLNGVINIRGLKSLFLLSNSISDISKEFVQHLNSTSIRTLDLGDNPLSCTCPIEPFVKWILNDTQVKLKVFDENAQYSCQTPNSLSGKSITEINLDCEYHLIFYLAVGISSGFVAILIVIHIVKYRWHIKYRLFLLCTWRRKYQPLLEEEQYDCFVSFAYDCDKDLKWVMNELRPNMEDGLEAFRLCIGHARDFIPGTPLLEAITEAIHNSHKTIIVLSPSYLESEWCYFETQHAWLRLLNEGQDVIILVLLEPIPDGKMTMWLRQFLCKKGYLRWPDNRSSQRLFFRCLREMVKKPNAVNRRYDA